MSHIPDDITEWLAEKTNQIGEQTPQEDNPDRILEELNRRIDQAGAAEREKLVLEVAQLTLDLLVSMRAAPRLLRNNAAATEQFCRTVAAAYQVRQDVQAEQRHEARVTVPQHGPGDGKALEAPQHPQA